MMLRSRHLMPSTLTVTSLVVSKLQCRDDRTERRNCLQNTLRTYKRHASCQKSDLAVRDDALFKEDSADAVNRATSLSRPTASDDCHYDWLLKKCNNPRTARQLDTRKEDGVSSQLIDIESMTRICPDISLVALSAIKIKHVKSPSQGLQHISALFNSVTVSAAGTWWSHGHSWQGRVQGRQMS